MAIVFYQLNARFLDRSSGVPEASKQVVYYTLAIGHHIGVVDCLQPRLRCTEPLYQQVLAALPEDGEARRKLAGLLRFGEITVERSHTAILRPVIANACASACDDVTEWLQDLDAALSDIQREPALYLIGRQVR